MPKHVKDKTASKSASLELVQEIRDLEEGINNQGRQINAVVTTGAWSLGFAAFLSHSITNPRSMYGQHLGHKLKAEYDNKIEQSVKELFNQRSNGVSSKDGQDTDREMLDTSNDPIFDEMMDELNDALFKSYPRQVNNNNYEFYLDKFNSDTTPQIKLRKNELKIKYQKWLIEDIINTRLPKFFKSGGPYVDKIKEEIYKLHEVPLNEFFYRFSTLRKFDELYKNTEAQFRRESSKEMDKIIADNVKAIPSNMRNMRFMIEVPVFTLGCLFTYAMINRRYPQGIFTRHITLPKANLQILDEKEAEEIKNRVKAKYLANKKAQTATKWVNRVATLIAVIGIINSSDIYFTIFSGMAFIAISIEFSQWISNDPFEKRRKAQQEKIAEANKALSLLSKMIRISYSNPTIGSNSVVITFNGGSINDKTYTGKEMCRLIQELAVKNSMNVETNFNNKMVINISDLKSGFTAILNVTQDDLISMIISERELRKQNKQALVLDTARLDNLFQPEIRSATQEKLAPIAKSEPPKKQKEKAPQKEDNTKPATPLKPIIRWRSGFFDPNSDTNTIKPVENGHGRHFTILLFKPADLPNREMYEALSRVISDHPTFVGGKGQGLKRFKNYVKNSQGEMVAATYKAKPKGEYGYMRAASYEEKSESGEVLHVFTANNIYRGH